MTNIPKLHINEIFSSIQGEGKLAGYYTHFIRLQGCRVGCPWCDTKQSWKKNSAKKNIWSCLDLSKEILRNMKEKDWICITGGEPFEQVESLVWLVEKLNRDFRRNISIETSGMIALDAKGNMEVPDKKYLTDLYLEGVFFSVSPKLPSALGNRFKQNNLVKIISTYLAIVDEPYKLQFKFVIGSKLDLQALESYFSTIKPDCHLYLQMEDSKLGTMLVEDAIAFVKQFNSFRLTTQQHKILNVR